MKRDSFEDIRSLESTLSRLAWNGENLSEPLKDFATDPGLEPATLIGCKAGGVIQETPGIGRCAFRRCRRLVKVSRFVELNIHRPIKQCEVASVIGLSTSQFSRVFRQKAGICFQDWLREQRVRRAMELIRQSDDAFGLIAFAVGFGSISAFNRSFKKITGMSPREFSQTTI